MGWKFIFIIAVMSVWWLNNKLIIFVIRLWQTRENSWDRNKGWAAALDSAFRRQQFNKGSFELIVNLVCLQNVVSVYLISHCTVVGGDAVAAIVLKCFFQTLKSLHAKRCERVSNISLAQTLYHCAWFGLADGVGLNRNTTTSLVV